MRRASANAYVTALMMLAIVAASAAAAGCRRPHATQPTAPRPSARAMHPTQYRPGEFVAYGFTGKAVPKPTMIREEIVDQSPAGIVLDVVIQREATDTEDRQHFKKTIDAKAVDLPRFTAWSLLVPDSPPDEDDKKTSEIVELAGQKVRCEITHGTMKVRGRKIRYVTSACPDFLWTHGPARYWDAETNETLLSIEVVEIGKETLCDYEKPSCASATSACAFVERGRSACVDSAVLEAPLGSPFRATQRFACTQRARSEAGRTHSFIGDLFAVDLASTRDAKSVEVLAPVSGEATVFDGCDAERADAPGARNDSRCGLGYGNHVRIWDGTNLVMLAHLAQVRATNGPVKRGDVVGVEGVSGAAGQRHVHVTVTRPRPTDDIRKILGNPGWKGQVPVRWKLDLAPHAAWVDELSCDEGLTSLYTGR